MRPLLAALALTALVAPAHAADDAEALGHQYAQTFLAGDLTQLWQAMTAPMQSAFGTIEALTAFRQSLTGDFGAETELLSEAVAPGAEGVATYTRTARWSLAASPLLMEITLDADSRIAGFLVQPAPVLADSRFLDYDTKTALTLPFNGQWFIVWGGRSLEQNYHASDGAQRFAIDALIVRDGLTHQGDPAVLANYYCWNQPIIAPAAGTVAAVVTDLPDNPIGTTDASHPAGNHVVLDFGNGEFGFLAHLQQGSVTVAPGDLVAAGQQLGLCGNSGNTSEPHLHFHLQTTPDLMTGEGLPAKFDGFTVNSAPARRDELLRGQVVGPA